MMLHRSTLGLGIFVGTAFMVAVAPPCRAAAVAELRADGVIVVDGQPFFPFGLWQESGTITSTVAIGYLRDMAAKGINCVHIKEIPGFTDIADEAARLGIKLFIETPSQNVLTAGTVDKFKNKPAIIGWSVRDDADDDRITVPLLAAFHAQVKAADPSRLTIISLTGWTATRRRQADQYIGTADISNYQSYPITPPPGLDVTPTNALRENYLRTRAYVDAANAASPKRPMLVASQTFSWGRTADSRFPTPLEGRNMMFASIAAGVKGIIGYTYLGLPTNAALWNEIGVIASEVKTIAPTLLNGTMARLATIDPDVVATTWTMGQEGLLIAINTSYAQSKTIALPLPNQPKALTPLFSARPSGLQLTGNAVEGTLLPQTVYVYRVSAMAGGMTPDAAPVSRDAEAPGGRDAAGSEAAAGASGSNGGGGFKSPSGTGGSGGHVGGGEGGDSDQAGGNGGGAAMGSGGCGCRFSGAADPAAGSVICVGVAIWFVRRRRSPRR